jgi:hypothetical protein
VLKRLMVDEYLRSLRVGPLKLPRWWTSCIPVARTCPSWRQIARQLDLQYVLNLTLRHMAPGCRSMKHGHAAALPANLCKSQKLSDQVMVGG